MVAARGAAASQYPSQTDGESCPEHEGDDGKDHSQKNDLD